MVFKDDGGDEDGDLCWLLLWNWLKKLAERWSGLTKAMYHKDLDTNSCRYPKENKNKPKTQSKGQLNN